MTKILYIIGAGGHGKVVADAAIKMNQWKEIYYLDNQMVDKKILGLKVKGSTDDALKFNSSNTEFIVAIGNNEVREKIQRKLQSQKCKLATIIHPLTTIGIDVSIGEGTVIFAGAVVNPSVNIGEGCILNTSCTVDHDSVIKDFVHISPGVHLAGNVKIGELSWLGLGTLVANNITINNRSIIGAGGVVIEDILKKGTYVGVPVSRIY